MRRLAFGLLLLPLSLQGERYRLRDGRMLEADSTVIREGMIRVVTPGEGAVAGEVSYPLSIVTQIEDIDPEPLRQARRSLEAGRAAEAKVDAERIVHRYAAFPRTPGSLWLEAQVLVLRALAALRRDPEARALAAVLQREPATPGQRSWMTFSVATVDARQTRLTEARTAFAMLLGADAPPELEREATLELADLCLAAEEWEQALESYLRIPAFHGTRPDLLPRALLGSARAYRGLKDTARMERTLFQLNDDHGVSSEAAVARREFAAVSPSAPATTTAGAIAAPPSPPAARASP
jgi:hypothetical protein